MLDGETDEISCRTCGKPRGENIAEGTRCAACGQRQALALWLASGVSAGATALTNGVPPGRALVVAGVVWLVMPPAFVGAVALHELAHVAAAMVLGQTVVRVILGEGPALIRMGAQPLVLVGRVVLGNGLTSVLDLRRDGYRWRACMMLLAAPVASFVLASGTWWLTASWPLLLYAAGLTFALCNLAMAVITMLPTPTFGRRVWSDLAAARFIAGATDKQLQDQMAMALRDAVSVRMEVGDVEKALSLARAGVDRAPASPLTHSLLAFVLHTAGRAAEAATVARAALSLEMGASEREYLSRFLPDASSAGPS